MNPIYQQMTGQSVPNVVQRFQQFRQMFTGDPRQQVQRLLDSGKVTQTQYNQAVQMANQFRQMLGIK